MNHDDGDTIQVLGHSGKPSSQIKGHSSKDGANGSIGLVNGRRRPRDVVQSSTLNESDAAVAADQVGKSNRNDAHKSGDMSGRIRRLWHRRDRSIGSSPLASGALNAETATTNSARNPTSSSARPNEDKIDIKDRNPVAEGERPSTRDGPLGYDTDPSQIINLALSLSESRRRNFSSATYHSGKDLGFNQRIASGTSQASGISGRTPRRHLHQQQLRVEGTSPQPNHRTISTRIPSRVSQGTQDQPTSPFTGRVNDFNLIVDTSDATLARVERAKEAFELRYEYRRLLRHLPEVPFDHAKLGPDKRDSKKAAASPNLIFGRHYNPLQYVRNRKVRLRERRPNNAEADGWKDLERVRNWVDTVIRDKEDDISPVDPSHLLPSFNAADADGIHSPDQESKPIPAKPPGRPPNDWTFSPWDMLADVYWSYQDVNLRCIEGPSGQKLYSTANIDVPTRFSQDSNREPRTSLQGSTATRPANGRKTKHATKLSEDIHGRYGTVTTDTETTDQRRRKKWRKGFAKSREPSMSDESDWDEQIRSRPKHQTEREHLDNLILEKQMADILATEGPDHRQEQQSPTDDKITKDEHLPSSVDASPQSNDSLTSSPSRPRPHRLKTDIPFLRKQFTPPRASLDDQVLIHGRKLSDDIRSLNPSSPSTAGYLPNITLNSSPPASPNGMPTSPPRPSTSRLRSFRHDRKSDKLKSPVKEHDHAKASQDSQENTERLPSVNDRSFLSKTASYNNSQIPRSSLDEVNSADHNRYLDISPSKQSLRDTNESDSRLRNFLKGGKMADLVGSQVSRAGDILRRKDRFKVTSEVNSPLSTAGSDIEDMSAFDSTSNDISRVTTNTDGLGGLSRMSTRSERPKYHMDNLPSFKSPSERRETSPKSPKASPDRDPIRVQQQLRKQQGRSSRFDRLAPPKIDMRSVSPSPSPPSSRRRNPARDRDRSRESSSRSRSRLSSHTQLNDMLGIPGQVGTVTKLPPPTGLSNLDPNAHPTSPKASLEDKRHWSITDCPVSADTEVTRREIARVRTLLLTSGIKANEITRRVNEMPSEPPKLLTRISDMIDTRPLPSVPRTQEHVTAARLLLAAIDANNRALHDAETHFTGVTVKDIGDRISDVDERINITLTPQVRCLADEADEFSAALASTDTLAVKQLNDNIDLVLRWRRRRSRWMTRGGWAMLEWVVLGTMWMVWFVVVLVRLLKGCGRGAMAVVRWLFLL